MTEDTENRNTELRTQNSEPRQSIKRNITFILGKLLEKGTTEVYESIQRSFL